MESLPSNTEVRRAAAEFMGDPATVASHAGVMRLFAMWPANTDLAEVSAKVALLDRVFGTNVYRFGAMAAHVVRLRIDPALAGGDVTVVERVADVHGNGMGKVKRAYSFATKYCAMHRADVYQIYDAQVERALWMFKRQTGFATFDRAEMATYPGFSRVIELFRAAFRLDAVSRLELDRYLWTVGSAPSVTPASGRRRPG